MADPDLQIRGVSGHPDPEIRWGGGAVSKKIFSQFASVWSKNKGGGPPGTLTYIRHCNSIKSKDIQLLDFNKIWLECLYMLVVNLLFAKKLVD